MKFIADIMSFLTCLSAEELKSSTSMFSVGNGIILATKNSFHGTKITEPFPPVCVKKDDLTAKSRSCRKRGGASTVLIESEANNGEPERCHCDEVEL